LILILYIDAYRKHLQHIDPFIELKQNNFYSSSKAIDVLLAQLNTDIEQTSDLVNNKSTIEQQFYNYMEVKTRRKKNSQKQIKLTFFFRFLFGVMHVIYRYQVVLIVLKNMIHFIK
jgi:hypothetical protein